MLLKIPKIAKIVASAHFIISSVFFISMVVYSQLWPNKEGIYPLFFVFMMMFLSVIDYPLAWLFENVSAIKSSPYLFFGLLVIFGTAMWFVIGLLLHKIATKKKGQADL